MAGTFETIRVLITNLKLLEIDAIMLRSLIGIK